MFVNNGKGLLLRFINLDIEKEIEITKEIRVIGKASFKDEDIVETVLIHKKIKQVEESAFENCKLKTICFGSKTFKKESSVENLIIESNSFVNCEELREVFINAYGNATCIIIKEGAFKNCKKLRTFYIGSDDFSNINIESGAFEGVDEKIFMSYFGGNGDPENLKKYTSIYTTSYLTTSTK